MSNHRLGNIFYRVITSEDAVTDVLCNLFMYKHIRDTLLINFFKIPATTVDKIKYEDIDTQKVSEIGKPDIQIINKKVEIYFEIKVKRSTTLQLTQKSSYLKKLDALKDSGKEVRMIYLVPKNYDHILELNKIEHSKDFIGVYIWEDFIMHIQEIDLHRSNQLVSEFINQYQALYVDETLSLILTSKEMELISKPQELIAANEVLSKLTKIMDASGQLIQKEFTDRVKVGRGLKGDAYWHDLGEKTYYIFCDGKPLLFYGLWYDIFTYYTSNPSQDVKQPSDYLFSYGTGTKGYGVKDNHLDIFKNYGDFIPYSDFLVSKFPNFTLSDEHPEQTVAGELIKRIKSLIE